jgi:hypothetical protein
MRSGDWTRAKCREVGRERRDELLELSRLDTGTAVNSSIFGPEKTHLRTRTFINTALCVAGATAERKGSAEFHSERECTCLDMHVNTYEMEFSEVAAS